MYLASVPLRWSPPFWSRCEAKLSIPTSMVMVLYQGMFWEQSQTDSVAQQNKCTYI
jgi:hypothetical protein